MARWEIFEQNFNNHHRVFFVWQSTFNTSSIFCDLSEMTKDWLSGNLSKHALMCILKVLFRSIFLLHILWRFILLPFTVSFKVFREFLTINSSVWPQNHYLLQCFASRELSTSVFRLKSVACFSVEPQNRRSLQFLASKVSPASVPNFKSVVCWSVGFIKDACFSIWPQVSCSRQCLASKSSPASVLGLKSVVCWSVWPHMSCSLQ